MQQILDFLLQHETIYQALLALALWFVFRSVPPSLLADLRSKAAATETPIDDIILMILERLNAQQPDAALPAPPQQPASSPPAQPLIPPEPIEPTPLPHATIPIENSGTVLKIDGREAWTPKGFDYEGVAMDGNNRHWVYLNAHFGHEPGLRLNIDGLAGMFDYTLTNPITIPNGQPFTAWLKYVGNITPNTESVPDPLHEWALWELWTDGKFASSTILQNGDQHVIFNFIGTGKPQKLTFRLYLKWAGFHDQSVLTWLEAGYGHTLGEGLS